MRPDLDEPDRRESELVGQAYARAVSTGFELHGLAYGLMREGALLIAAPYRRGGKRPRILCLDRARGARPFGRSGDRNREGGEPRDPSSPSGGAHPRTTR